MSKIDYDLTKIEGIVFDIDGVLSPTTVPMSAEGIPQRMANLKDGFAMVAAVRAGLKLAIISGANVPGARERFSAIGLTDINLGIADKLPVLKAWMEAHGLQPEQVAYVGDDVPDLGPLHHVGLPVAPADASRDAMEAAKYITGATGGHGVARELLEEIMRSRGLWPA